MKTTTYTLTISRGVKRAVAFLLAICGLLVLTAGSCQSEEYKDRQQQQEVKKTRTENSQEKANLREKIKRDEASANKVSYVYLMTYGEFVGYYAIKGKISSNGSQISAEDDITCVHDNSSDCLAVDGPQDDGTYGEGDPGIFFFTTEGALVVTSLDYLSSDQPIATAINVPKLNGTKR